jgi:very-short-patch-repair endonuclease
MDAIRPLGPKEAAERAIARLAATQHGVFSRAQALALGATDAHLKHGIGKGRYVRLRRGVLAAVTAAPSFEHRVMAACLANSGTFASHRTAARLWRLAGIDECPVELTSTGDRRGGAEVTIYRTRTLAQCDVAVVRSIPVTATARTIIDLAGVVDESSLEIALDDALRRRLTSMARLQWRLADLGGHGRKGTAAMRRLMAQRTSGPVPESALETRVVRALRTAGLPPPRRQYRIRHEGRTVARVDLAWPEQCVALEVDSYRYHSGRHEWERDLARRNSLEAAGWTVVHVTAQLLTTGEAAFVRQLRALLVREQTFFGEK